MSSETMADAASLAPGNDGLGLPAESVYVERAEAIIERAKNRVAAAKAAMDSKIKEVTAPAPPSDLTAEPAVERASAMLDRTGETVGRWATAAALFVRRTTALAREEAEDMLAEAQALRKPQS